MYATLRAIPVILAATPLLASVANTQIAEDAVGSRWGVSLTLALAYGSMPSDIEEAMVETGLRWWSCDWGNCISFPDTYNRGFRPTLTVSYDLRPSLQLRGILGSDNLRETIGKKYFSSTQHLRHIRVAQDVFTVAVIPALIPARGLRVGVGPSLNFVEVTDVTGGKDGHSSTRVRPGLVLDGGFTIPTGSRLFLEITGQYRYVLPADVGPFERPGPGDEVLTLPRRRVNPSYAVVGLGLGVRL